MQFNQFYMDHLMVLNLQLRGLSDIIKHGNSLSTRAPWKATAIMLGSYGNFEVLREAIDSFSQIDAKLHCTLHTILGGGLQAPEQNLQLCVLSLCHMDQGGLVQFLQSSEFIRLSHIFYLYPMTMSVYVNLISLLFDYRFEEKIILNIQYLNRI